MAPALGLLSYALERGIASVFERRCEVDAATRSAIKLLLARWNDRTIPVSARGTLMNAARLLQARKAAKQDVRCSRCRRHMPKGV